MAHHAKTVVTLPLFVALLCSAQEPRSAPGQETEHSETYKLRQSVRTVVLDVSVVDPSGRPVAGLKAGDFQITEDGAPQRISFFQGQDQHALPPLTQELKGTDLVERSGQAPLTILLMDEISTEPEDLAFARKQLATYLAKQPAYLASPTMLLALTGRTLKRLADYTTDRDVLIKAIQADNDPPSWYVLRNRQAGFKATNLETAGERLGIYLATLNELAAATEPYHTRKNIIWVGPGLPALDQTVALQGDQQRAIRNSVHSVVTNLVRARVTLYTIDPQGLIVDPTQIAHHEPGGGALASGGALISIGGDPAEGELVFEQLAPATGGKIFRMRNDVAGEIGASVADGTAYYTVAYSPRDKNFDGKFRRIGVTLRDPNLVARTREGYMATDTSPDRAELAAQAMAFAITSGLRYEGVRTTARFGEPGSAPIVHIEVDNRDLDWSPDATQGMEYANVTIVVANIRKDGKPGDYKLEPMHARGPAAATRNAKADFVVSYTPDPKAALVRVLVRDPASGHIGTFDLPVRDLPVAKTP